MSAADPSSPPNKRIKTTDQGSSNMEPAPALQVRKLSDKGRLPTRGSAFAAGYDPGHEMGGREGQHFIDTGAGVIDADYRGQVKVLLFNHADADFDIKEGDRVAQLVLERIVTPDVVEVQELEESVRGAGGFGSTGKQ
ncbi:deoxyuridine 5'-triphosphate nucleotidohydrolase [Ophiocordyceps sinensis CO18]|uniref:Deoxyuridine 5'-triphosphate nucleotidohydrolase n=1 Tax=Ophiocordyceps sinensis (strain Co18 / CGMCC 3.14243) TaxID=911162 RepID=T5AHA9_OPHSC|nr:deoxyuridine 5'-triphosphate nucleotidohydrolase [Ophiocordyceps sinensis CO18]